VNNLSEVALDCAAAGIEPATSSRKSNTLTTAPPSSVIVGIRSRTFPDAAAKIWNEQPDNVVLVKTRDHF